MKGKGKKKVWVGWISSHRKAKQVLSLRHCLGLVPRILSVDTPCFGKKQNKDDKKIRITVEEI